MATNGKNLTSNKPMNLNRRGLNGQSRPTMVQALMLVVIAVAAVVWLTCMFWHGLSRYESALNWAVPNSQSTLEASESVQRHHSLILRGTSAAAGAITFFVTIPAACLISIVFGFFGRLSRIKRFELESPRSLNSQKRVSVFSLGIGNTIRVLSIALLKPMTMMMGMAIAAGIAAMNCTSSWLPLAIGCLTSIVVVSIIANSDAV